MKIGRNIVFCNFTNKEKQMVLINDIRDSKEYWEYGIQEEHRFPYIKYADSFKDLFRSKGFMIVIKKEDININDFDLKYHNKLKGFNYIAILDKKSKNFNQFDKYSKIGVINYDMFCCEYSNIYIEDFYNNYKKNNKKKNVVLSKNYKYEIIKILKNNKIVSSKDLSKLLGVSIRSIQRYMNILSSEGYNVRYNKSTNRWFYLKKQSQNNN